MVPSKQNCDSLFSPYLVKATPPPNHPIKQYNTTKQKYTFFIPPPPKKKIRQNRVYISVDEFIYLIIIFLYPEN